MQQLWHSGQLHLRLPQLSSRQPLLRHQTVHRPEGADPRSPDCAARMSQSDASSGSTPLVQTIVLWLDTTQRQSVHRRRFHGLITRNQLLRHLRNHRTLFLDEFI